MPTGLPLQPKLLARAGKIAGLLVPQGDAETFRVHVRQHEYLAGFAILDHRRDETALIEFQFLDFHVRTSLVCFVPAGIL